MPGLIRVLFILGDLILLNFSLAISLKLTNHSWAAGSSNTIYLLIFSNLSWIYLVIMSTPYNLNKGWSMARLIRGQIAFILVHLLVVASLIFFFKRDYSALQIGLIYLLFVPFSFGSKILIYYLKKVFAPEVLSKNYILIGQSAMAKEIRKYYLLNPQLKYKFKGYLDIEESDLKLEGIRSFCAKNDIHEIQCCITEMKELTFRSLINFGLDSLIKVKIVVDNDNSQKQSIQFEKYEFPQGKDIAIIPLDEARYQLIKRLFDIFFSSIFLILIMSWLFPILAVLIMIDSKGPIFFIQFRSGKDNKPFKCLKFRTMKMNPDSDKKQATKDDPRITKLGYFLRKTSIDELPQFINVFTGNMSVVGPRPHMLKHTEEYAKLIEKFMGRHYVKPGITGLAQCLGYRGETYNLIDMKNRVRMDRYYIENWSFGLDLKIIFLTVVSLIRGSEKAF
jgi:putative colanic acid biosynthesis UDP-glucose lipid carrier transferase